MIDPYTNEKLEVGDTSSRWYAPIPADAVSLVAGAEQVSTAWGTAVIAIKWAQRNGGPGIEFQPAIRIGPPASGLTTAVTPLLDVRCKPWLVFEVTTAESGEYVRAWFTVSSAQVPV